MLFQDIYNNILIYVNDVNVIKNVMISNTMLREATKYIEYIDDNVLFKFLTNKTSDTLKFPHLKEVRGDIIVCEDDDCEYVKMFLLKHVNMKNLSIKCRYVDYTDAESGYGYYNLDGLRAEKILIDYSSFSHLFDSFQISSANELGKVDAYRLTKTNDNIIRLQFSDDVCNIDVDKIFSLIVGYEYHLVLTYDTDTFLTYSNYNSEINISTLIITEESKLESVMGSIISWSSIKTIIIEDEDNFFNNDNNVLFPQITNIIHKPPLYYYSNQDHFEIRVTRLLEFIRHKYINAKLQINIHKSEISTLNLSILYHRNVTLKYITSS